MNFHSALSTTTAAANAKGKDSRQVGLKQTRDAEPQSAGPRKKNDSSVSSVPDATSLLAVPSKPLPQALPVSLPVTLPSSGEASVQASEDAQTTGIPNSGIAVLSSSATSNSSSLPTLPNEPGDITGKSEATDGNLKLSLPLTQTPFESGMKVHQESVIGGTNPQSRVDTAGAITEPIAPQSSAVDQTSAASSSIAQQTAAAVAQSVAAPVSLPNLNSATELQPVAAGGRDAGPSGLANTLTGAASRQALPVSKAKPASTSIEMHGKAADDADAQGQSPNGTATSTPIVKLPESAVTLAHPIVNSHGALDAAALQSVSTGASAAPLDHIEQRTQAISSQASPAAQPTSVPAPADAPSIQGLSSAQLTQSMRSSEMKLGMQSAEFGNISISTSLNHQAISAQISIDHAELGRALAIHLPAIEEKLGSSYGLQAKVELRESNNPSSSNESAYSNSGQQSRQQRQTDQGSSSSGQTAMFAQGATASSLATRSVTVSGSRLDIRI